MSKLCWYYAILQTLILILIFQASNQNRSLKLSLNQQTTPLKPIYDPTNRIQLKPINCLGENAKNKLKQFLNIMERNVYGSGYDPVIGKIEDQYTKNNETFKVIELKNNDRLVVHEEKRRDNVDDLERSKYETKSSREYRHETHTTTTTTQTGGKGQTTTRRQVTITETNPHTGKPQKIHTQTQYVTPLQ